MKHILLALICIMTLASCEDTVSSPRALTPLACTDPETGIEMSKEACDTLESERQRREEAEDRLNDNPQDKTPKPSTTPNPTAQTTPTPSPDVTPTPTSNNFTEDDGYFVHEELGMRFSIREGYRVERLEIPEQPTSMTTREDTIGYFRVRANDGDDFIIVVERFAEGLDDDGLPVSAPFEGAVSKEWVELPGGIKGYEFDSDAFGYNRDAHVTIFREDKIYYLREMNREESVSNRLRAFAREFEITN